MCSKPVGGEGQSDYPSKTDITKTLAGHVVKHEKSSNLPPVTIPDKKLYQGGSFKHRVTLALNAGFLTFIKFIFYSMFGLSLPQLAVESRDDRVSNDVDPLGIALEIDHIYVAQGKGAFKEELAQKTKSELKQLYQDYSKKLDVMQNLNLEKFTEEQQRDIEISREYLKILKKDIKDAMSTAKSEGPSRSLKPILEPRLHIENKDNQVSNNVEPMSHIIKEMDDIFFEEGKGAFKEELAKKSVSELEQLYQDYSKKLDIMQNLNLEKFTEEKQQGIEVCCQQLKMLKKDIHKTILEAKFTELSKTSEKNLKPLEVFDLHNEIIAIERQGIDVEDLKQSTNIFFSRLLENEAKKGKQLSRQNFPLIVRLAIGEYIFEKFRQQDETADPAIFWEKMLGTASKRAKIQEEVKKRLSDLQFAGLEDNKLQIGPILNQLRFT